MEYTVGQKLWFAPTQKWLGKPREVTIEKVGRKWLTLSNAYRVSVDDLTIDGGNASSPGRCYLSEQEHRDAVELDEAWRKFGHKVFNRYVVPDGVTVEMIKQIRVMLFGEGGE